MTISRSTNPYARYTFACFAFLLLSGSVTFAESIENDFQINFATEIPVAGTLSIDDDPLFGVEFTYFFLRSKPHHFFVSGGYLTDADKTGGAIDIINVNIGSQFDLPLLWGKRTYLEYAVGATYSTEEYAFELLDREVTESFSESGFKASLVYGLEFNQHIGTKLSLNQYDGDSTSIGLNFFYSF